jgi:phosphatidylserine/phosphatidylglycerophosphate/cardiolipin synthase-like enzyme
MFESFLIHLKKSVSDGLFVSSEKQHLKRELESLNLTKRQCDLLRSELFKHAQSVINSINYSSVLNWVEEINKLLLTAPKEEAPSESIYFSPGESCLNAIISAIKNLKKEAKICLFTISDDRISDELITAHNRGVQIKIITDNDKLFDKGSDINKLTDAGILVKTDFTDRHMHHKFALFDNKMTITGSYNWTRSAEQYNHENVLTTNSKRIYTAFEEEFDRLWNNLIRYE